MNKNYTFIGMFLILLIPFKMMSQYASNYKLTNFQQQNESYFEFDLELHNTGSIAFGMEAAACRIDFNQYISGGLTLDAIIACTAISTDLVGEYGKVGENPPTIDQKCVVSLNNEGYLIFNTGALQSSWPLIDLVEPGRYKKLAKIKIMLATANTVPTQKNKTFNEILPDLELKINANQQSLLIVNVYNDLLQPPNVYKDTEGSIPNYASIHQALKENLAVSTLSPVLTKNCNALPSTSNNENIAKKVILSSK